MSAKGATQMSLTKDSLNVPQKGQPKCHSKRVTQMSSKMDNSNVSKNGMSQKKVMQYRYPSQKTTYLKEQHHN